MPHTVIIGAGIIGASTAYFLSHSPSRGQDHEITILDPCPPASGASGKAAGFLSHCWTGSASASLENLSFRLYKELAQECSGAEKWGYRPCRVLAVVGGRRLEGDSEDLRWGERFKSYKLTEYSGDLGWISPETISSKSILGEAGSFAQWYSSSIR
jgi:glycine/D-amino acid oxidase-like deaminating enzyme